MNKRVDAFHVEVPLEELKVLDELLVGCNLEALKVLLLKELKDHLALFRKVFFLQRAVGSLDLAVGEWDHFHSGQGCRGIDERQNLSLLEAEQVKRIWTEWVLSVVDDLCLAETTNLVDVVFHLDFCEPSGTRVSQLELLKHVLRLFVMD